MGIDDVKAWLVPGARFAAYICFGFSGLAALVFGYGFTFPLDDATAAGFAMVLPIILDVPMVRTALMGMILSLLLREPRGLLLLAVLTFLETVFLTWAFTSAAFSPVGPSLLVYGVVVSGYVLIGVPVSRAAPAQPAIPSQVPDRPAYFQGDLSGSPLPCTSIPQRQSPNHRKYWGF